MKAEYISHYLTDTDVANFARQSFNKRAEDYTDKQNASLIRFLARGVPTKEYEASVLKVEDGFKSYEEAEEFLRVWRDRATHWVPFSHPHISLRMQAPTSIRTQCFKHKQGLSESEESRRYIKSEPEVFVPRYFRMAAANVKQGSHDEAHLANRGWVADYKRVTEEAVKTYLDMIGDGIPPEQARFVLPQGTEVNWVWTGSLYAFANFYKQRTDSHAQKEIQDLAREVGAIIEPLYPVSWGALTK